MDAVKNFYISNGEIKKTKEWTDEPNGKVIYEVIRIINGKPLFYEEHYERMKNSFKLSNVEFKITEEELKEDIDKARQAVSYLVSRNTDELTKEHIVSATIESLTENITDSYISPVFYFIIISLIGIFTDSYVVLFILILIPFNYRIFNTLDAMVGYKTDELIDIGFVPAKIDDILNYIPSRIAGLFVVLSAFCLNFDYKNSYKILKRDARNCPSPNSGFTMASAAGALNIQLIKLDTYILGDNNKNIETSDIGRAVKLSKLAIFLFTVTIILFIIILYVILWK